MTGKITTSVNRKKVWYAFIIMAVIVVCAVIIALPQKLPTNWPLASFFNKFDIHLGLDLQGGAHLVYEADVSQVSALDPREAVEGARDVIERRVNAFGVSEPVVQTSTYGGSHRVIVELAGIQDVNQAIKMIGETPLLEFKEQAPNAATSTVSSDDKAIQEKALQVLARAVKGDDFAKLTQEFSDDTGSAAQGGDVGYASAETNFVPEYKNAILDPNVKVGQVLTQLVKTQFGYHIIKITDIKIENNQRQVRSSHILFKTATEPTENWLNTNLTGKNLKRSYVEFDQTTGQPNVALSFDDDGKKIFAELTQRNIGKPIAIFLDGTAISVPTVQTVITEGRAVITGNFTLREAKLLAQRLNAGALPVPIKLVSQQTIGPTLGKVSVERSLLAGFLGLLSVALFMIIYYRLPGLLAVVALLTYTAISIAIFEIWPVTLTLAGIAGFILSIGMAVDANVLIFERLREEIRAGKAWGQAVEDSFHRAWLAIRDSNISSLITCIILAWFSSGIVKGFAITLAIGIGISMFTAITFTRTILRLTLGGRTQIKRWLIGW